jgi:hypothetical protein
VLRSRSNLRSRSRPSCPEPGPARWRRLKPPGQITRSRKQVFSWSAYCQLMEDQVKHQIRLRRYFRQPDQTNSPLANLARRFSGPVAVTIDHPRSAPELQDGGQMELLSINLPNLSAHDLMFGPIRPNGQTPVAGTPSREKKARNGTQ